jgi:hypothetical protein
MRVLIVLSMLLSSLLVTGCQKRVDGSLPRTANFELAAPGEAQYRTTATANTVDRTLAYEHLLDIEIAKALLEARMLAVKKSCAEDKNKSCTLLEIANHESNGVPKGTIKMRIAPGTADDLMRVASEGGRILSRRTSAEDLAEPIADTERQLALLNLHRQRLTEFMARKDINVSDLITVSRELADVQTQLERFDSQRLNLRRRVDTELITINWHAPFAAYEDASTPVSNALKSFGANFTEAIAQVITFVAYIVPWIVIVIPSLTLVRWSWRRVAAWRKRERVEGART